MSKITIGTTTITIVLIELFELDASELDVSDPEFDSNSDSFEFELIPFSPPTPPVAVGVFGRAVVGAVVGAMVGASEGELDGLVDGASEGASDGVIEGRSVGAMVGASVGGAVLQLRVLWMRYAPAVAAPIDFGLHWVIKWRLQIMEPCVV
jgi:hypothetical protein